MSRTRIAATLALLATLTGGGAAYAGTTGTDDVDRTQCNPTQAGNVIGGAQLCPITVDPTVDTDLDVDPFTSLPIITELR